MILIQPSIDPVIFSFGIIQLRWYSLAYVLGFLLGLYLIKQINFKQKYKIENKKLDDFFIWSVVGVILGGRIGYILFYQTSTIIYEPIKIFYIWEGGMSFHGGLIGIIASMIIFSRYKSIRFFQISDLVSSVAPIGLFFGRIANFINAELVGKFSTLPWAVTFPNIDNLTRHPSQIYQAILEGIILFIIINFLALKKKLIFKTGYISSLFLIFYSLLRIFGEFFREPDEHLGYLFGFFSMGTLLSILTLIAGFLLIFLIKKNEQNY